MSLWRRSWNWLRDVCRLSRVEHEMDLELRSHLEAYTHDLICSGMSPEEARRRAMLEFGGRDDGADRAPGDHDRQHVDRDRQYSDLQSGLAAEDDAVGNHGAGVGVAGRPPFLQPRPVQEAEHEKAEASRNSSASRLYQTISA